MEKKEPQSTVDSEQVPGEVSAFEYGKKILNAASEIARLLEEFRKESLKDVPSWERGLLLKCVRCLRQTFSRLEVDLMWGSPQKENVEKGYKIKTLNLIKEACIFVAKENEGGYFTKKQVYERVYAQLPPLGISDTTIKKYLDKVIRSGFIWYVGKIKPSDTLSSDIYQLRPQPDSPDTAPNVIQ